MHIIPQELWYTCRITGRNIKDIHKNYGGRGGVYRTETFQNYLKTEHNLTIEQYFLDICKIVPPFCPCGCEKICKINKKPAANFRFGDYACGNNLGVQKWSKEAKITRKGSNNPMYGRIPWNLGKTQFNDPTMLEASTKMKIAKRKWLINNPTIPHIKIKNLLLQLDIDFIEEFISSYWIFDFHLIKYNTFIEVDGDYYHCNPAIYPNGPIDTRQKNQKIRDCDKSNYCKNNNIELIRFWEKDIHNNIENIKCILQKL